MSRLTAFKNGKHEKYEIKDKFVKNYEIINKLGQKEEDDEKLEMDSHVYFKLMDALYCGDDIKFYVEDNGERIEVKILEIDYCKKKVIFYKDTYKNEYVEGFRFYGKSWFMEELENEKIR